MHSDWNIRMMEDLDDDVCALSLPPPSWKAPSRDEMVGRLESEEEFDVLVIGGGAVGADGRRWVPHRWLNRITRNLLMLMI